MKRIRNNRFYLLLAIWMITGMFFPKFVYSQVDELVFKKEFKIDPEKKNELSFELDNISFFKNNEFAGTTQNGYTLPGLWVQPKLVYYPLKNIKLELGAHMLKYWGSMKYPSVAYQGIPGWNSDDYQKGYHMLVFFRAQIALSEHVDLILGNIYGGANHNLIEPLYNPELNLTADPEAGLQLLYTSRFLELDSWVNWQSFIFNEDVHQEAFTFGVSARAKLNNPESKFHAYVPLQLLFSHHGGEIDTITVSSVQTWMNAAAGAGLTYNINCGILKRANLEVMGTYFGQQAGDMLPIEKGYGIYSQLALDIYDFRVKASYFKNKDFISLYGNPIFGAISTAVPDRTYQNPGVFSLGAEYAYSFGKGFSLGIDCNIYNQSAVWAYEPDKAPAQEVSALSFAVGVYFRINPSFLIKKF